MKFTVDWRGAGTGLLILIMCLVFLIPALLVGWIPVEEDGKRSM